LSKELLRTGDTTRKAGEPGAVALSSSGSGSFRTFAFPQRLRR
jgi:hypothetical protein